MLLELDSTVLLLVDEAGLLVEFLLMHQSVGAGEIHFELRHEPLLRRCGLSAPVVSIVALWLLWNVLLHVDGLLLLVGLLGLVVMGGARKDDLLTHLWLVVLVCSSVLVMGGGPAMVVAEAAAHVILGGEATLLLEC